MKNKILMTVLLTLAFVIGGNILFAETSSGVINAKSTGTVNATYLNVRTGPGTDKAVLMYQGANVGLKMGETVTILKETNGWYQISFTYQTAILKGYVLGDYIKLLEESAQTSPEETKEPKTSSAPASSAPASSAPASSMSIPAKITADSLKVRKTASASGEQLTVGKTKVALKKGTAVKILKEKTVKDKKWYYISFTYNGATKKGYILSDYAKLSFTKNVSATVKSSEKVTVRKGAGSDKTALKINGTTVSLKNKQDIVITLETADAKGNKWFKVSFLHKEEVRNGYILANKATLTGNVNKTGTVNATSLTVRKKPGTTQARLTLNGTGVSLKKGSKVTIDSSKTAENVTWYKVSFTYEGKTLSGYVSGQYVTVDTTAVFPTPAPAPTPKPTPGPEETQPPAENPVEIDDKDFDAYLTEQGFPDSYKEALALLHENHPNWIFKAYHTGLDWNTVIEKESKAGLNLINKNKSNGWKSYESGAYNWAADEFIPYDGSAWVTASKEAIEYYMDPRNFLYQNSIFQFEALEYQSGYQVQNGVEAVLKNTPMNNISVSFFDENTQDEATMLYSRIFMDAAEQSGVSPYHLATRVKQEVIKSATAFSDSVTGTVAGYEGYYNFYNIGATHSTEVNGAIINALKFASGSTTTNAAARANYLLPWDNPYKAIVGGAKYIGTNYINRGQNTIYLQKFNVTPTSTYTHQYMANVEAANSEAAKTYTAYSGMEMMEEELVFNIPVYYNMPNQPAQTPQTVPSPNNWLKTLKVDNYTLTPKFNAADGGKNPYSLTVSKDVSSVNLSAVQVNSKAAVEVYLEQDGNNTMIAGSGTTTVSLKNGSNTVTIKVTAENGDVNIYTINITKAN